MQDLLDYFIDWKFIEFQYKEYAIVGFKNGDYVTFELNDAKLMHFIFGNIGAYENRMKYTMPLDMFEACKNAIEEETEREVIIFDC